MKSIRSLNKPPSHGVPFFPGIAHSQFIRFIVPSGFFVGTATKPKGWSFLQAFLSCARRLRAIPDIFKVPGRPRPGPSRRQRRRRSFVSGLPSAPAARSTERRTPAGGAGPELGCPPHACSAYRPSRPVAYAST